MSRIRLLSALLATVVLAAPARAQTYTWQGGAASNNWSLAANWVGGSAPPVSGTANLVFTDANFGATHYVFPYMDDSYSVSSLMFSGASTFNLGYSLPTGFYLTIGTGGLSQTSSSNQFINIPVTLNGSQTWSFTGAGSLTLPGFMVQAGAATINGGTLFLTTGDNSSFNVGGGVGSAVASLLISSGAVVNVTSPYPGLFINGPAGTTVVVSGTGSRLNSGSYIGVGYSGNLTVQNGGSVVETTQSLEVGTLAGDNGTVLIQSGGTVTTSGLICGVNSGSAGSVTVTGSGSNLLVTGLTALSYPHGSGSLAVTNGGTATLSGGIQFGNDPTSVTVNGGTLSTPELSVPGAAPTVLLSDPANGCALTIGANNTSSSYSGPIADAAGGPGTVNKVGTGTLTLTGVLTNTGGYTAAAGTIEFSGAVVQPGSGSLSAAAGATIQYDTGARVFGGFLRGPGTHVVTGGSTMTGVTSAASAVINVTGSATFASFTNGGALNVSAGAANPTTLNLFTNEGSGSITVAAASKISAADFQSYGTLTLTPGPSSSSASLLTNTGTTPLYFNGGSRTFLGTAATAINPATGQPADLAGINLNGQNAVVAGGLFVNNGFVADGSPAGSATIIADFGSLVKGAGFFQNSVITQNGGKFQAGNSPGSASFGSFVLGPGGVDSYVFAIDDATGMAGPHPNAAGQVSGWGLVSAVRQQMGLATTSGNFTWTADPGDKLTVALETLVNPTIVGTDVAGPMADFDPSQAYSWPAVRWTGTYSGPTDVAALDAATSFDTTGFENPISGTFGWSLDAGDQALSLTYNPTPVPEPGTLALTGIAAIGWVTFWRRRWQSNGPAATLSV